MGDMLYLFSAMLYGLPPLTYLVLGHMYFVYFAYRKQQCLLSGVNPVILFGCSVYPGHFRGIANGEAFD